MDPTPVSFFVEAAGGRLSQGAPDGVVHQVSTDTRSLGPGALFVALRGERFDGHAFVMDAAQRGAAAVMVERPPDEPLPSSCGLLLVEDTRAALGRIASAWRRRFHLRIVAVAGSNGKTTTKDLLAAGLGGHCVTLASEASFNNDVGVPLTLLRLGAAHQVAVLEVGTNHPGELAPLLRLVQPDLGVLTSLGREHLEFFGDLEGVVQEEGWLAELLPPTGHLWVNGDTPRVDHVIARSRASVTRVGFGAGHAWRATAVHPRGTGVCFEVAAPDAAYSGVYELPLVGRHQVGNALLALAVAAEMRVPRDVVARGLARCPLPRRRLESWTAGDVRVLDDAYNANADSVRAALDTLGELPCAGRRIAVLGDMAELGEAAAPLHAEVGRHTAEIGIDQLFAVGRMAGVLGAAARDAGLHRVLEFSDVEAAAVAVTKFVRPADIVLVKASRASRLERVSEALRLALRDS